MKERQHCYIVDSSIQSSVGSLPLPVINAANDDAATGDMLTIDIDSVGKTTQL